ncbi:ABC transporter permease [Brucella intermedia]|uniref:ABC transporter permease n=1 Tax=Brucella intermedia TaxID=94625 RepID=UPI00224B2D5E|nr:ABC transporter permease [Brucella intermedia]
MIALIAQRLLQAVVVVLIMTVIVFIGVNVIGNPVDIMISPQADQAEKARIIVELGLDQPLWRQYLHFLGGFASGDFGVSYVYNRPAFAIILERLPATLELAVTAMLISVLIGVPLGLVAGLYPRAFFSRMLMSGSIVGFSLPTFWVGLLFIMFFSVHLGWLPSGGRGPTQTFLGVQWSFLTWEGLRHMLLPALNLALFKASLVLRMTQAGVREVMPLNYVRLARAKGLGPARVIFVHVLRNVMIPVVTVIGLEFGSLIAFSVVTETIFAWPGMGKLIIDSIGVLDRPVMVAYLMVIVVMFVLINLIVDLIYGQLDPRVRQQIGGRRA